MLTRKMTITIKNEEADEVGRGYQLNGASTIPTSGLVEWPERVEDETKVRMD